MGTGAPLPASRRITAAELDSRRFAAALRDLTAIVLGDQEGWPEGLALRAMPKPGARIMLKVLLVAVFVLIAVLLLSVWAWQRFGIYRFDTARRAPAEFGLADVRVVSFRSADGTQVAAWVAPPRGDSPVVLSFFGNFSGAGESAARLKPLLEQGLGLAMLVYRGSSGEVGEPSEANFAMDAVALYDSLDELLGQRIPADRRVLHGFSLGSSVAAGLAAEREAAGLVLEASFDRCCRWYTKRMRGLPMCLLMWRERHDVVDKLAGVAMPKLFLHGQLDDAIPVEWGRLLHDAVPGEKRFVVFERGGHADLTGHGALTEFASFVQALPRAR